MSKPKRIKGSMVWIKPKEKEALALIVKHLGERPLREGSKTIDDIDIFRAWIVLKKLSSAI